MGSSEQTDEPEIVPANEPFEEAAAEPVESTVSEAAPEPAPSIVKAGIDTADEAGIDAADEAEQKPTPKKIKRETPRQKRSRSGLEPNNVRKLRQEAMMSKAELARRAGVSPLTIDRVEAGSPCRMDTKRKILEALGLKPSARAEVWPDIDEMV